MKLTPLAAFPFLHEALTKSYRVLAGAQVTGSQVELLFRIEAITREAFSAIVIPAVHPKPTRRDELWKTTCFECFLPVKGATAYLEFNGSPSGDWNWYSFSAYRAGMKPVPLTSRLEPKAVSMSLAEKVIEMLWVLPMGGVTQGFASQGESVHQFDPLGLSVVLQTNEVTTYWAMSHEGVKPDFHTRASFRYDSVWN